MTEPLTYSDRNASRQDWPEFELTAEFDNFDRPEFVRIHPRNCEPARRATQWVCARADSAVDLEAVR